MREWLKNEDDVTTSSDYILKHIMPEIKYEGLNDGRTIPNAVLRILMKFKTEELILWQIAKFYWKKANKGAEYNFDSYLKNSESRSYQVFSTFNKVYKQDLDYIIRIETDFWNKEGNKLKFNKVAENNPQITDNPIEIKLKIPAKRYDNQFLGVETGLITEYCLWNHCQNNSISLPVSYQYTNKNNKTTILNLQVYDDLIKIIHIELKKSLEYIGSLLVAEKKVVDNDSFHTIRYLKEKYANKVIPDFYLTLSDKDMTNDYNKAIFDRFMAYVNNTGVTHTDIREYLVCFRNFALHYQLQDPIRSKEIEQLLEKINMKITQSDYFEKE